MMNESARSSSSSSAKGEDSNHTAAAAAAGGGLDRLLPVLATLQDVHSLADRMAITDEERQWSLAIKAAIESDVELDNLTDYQYAQLGIIDQDHVEGAVDRARQMQLVREEYALKDTYKDGVYFVHAFMKQHPRVVLSVEYHPDDGNYGRLCLFYFHV
jgi:hypothetical protein